MTIVQKPYQMITDFITDQSIPNIGAEENRQKVEKFLVLKKCYDKSDILVDVDLDVSINNERYQSQIDLVVKVNDHPQLLIKCVPGSLSSRERETIAAARILYDTPLPYAVISDGSTALVFETGKGKMVGEGMDAILSKPDLEVMITKGETLRKPLTEAQSNREKLIFRTYDQDDINVKRNLIHQSALTKEGKMVEKENPQNGSDNEKEPDVCVTSETPEQARTADDNDVCDDGRAGK